MRVCACACRALEAERLELERLHADRLAQGRAREEEMLGKLRRQQVHALHAAHCAAPRLTSRPAGLRRHSVCRMRVCIRRQPRG